MSNSLKIGVIGLGLIGKLHARILHEMPNAQLVAVSDIDKNVAESISNQFNCKCYTDFKEMCNNEQLDAVSICSPDQFHAENAIYAAKKGINILIEKPIAPTVEEALSIKKAALDNNISIMVAHLLHFDPRYAQIKEAIKTGKIGDIVHMYFRRTNPKTNCIRLKGKVSIFYFIGIHDFEMMCSYMGCKPVKVYSQKVSKVNANISSEDTVISIINFENDSIGVIELCWALPENSALGINAYAEIVGTNGVGYINIMDQGVSIITKDSVDYPDILHWPEYNSQINGDLKDELSHFVKATLEKKPYITDIDNAILSVKIVEACFKSIETGYPVDIN